MLGVSPQTGRREPPALKSIAQLRVALRGKLGIAAGQLQRAATRNEVAAIVLARLRDV